MTIKKIAGSNKGVTLILVIVVLTVVTILANILIETAFQNYRMGKASGYTDYSYYAGESAIQKCCDILNAKCADPALADTYSITYNGVDKDFAVAVVNALAGYIGELSAGGSFNDFDVNDDTGNMADIAIELEYLDYSRDELSNPGKIEIEIGLAAQSSYVVKPFLSGDKKVYAKKKFLVTVPSGFELRGPVYTIGDLMADHSNVDILGDVHVYGTSPEYLKSPKQYYYGGIFAKSNSEMKIRGNAYSRSFIRTGLYSNPGGDTSSVYVYKDAVAQCLQIFGEGQRIAVLRNAYTFDDLEVNGENSVLAVNGSFFGLSDGGGAGDFYHDSSSAIVNSATLHHFNSFESQKSRIVINGAVMVNGGTFRIDDDGNTHYQIEDASLAWFTDPLNPSPVYKNAPVPLDGSYSTYVKWLKDYDSELKAKGFGNLFQVYNPVGKWIPDDPAELDGTNTAYGRLNAWLNKIDLTRLNGNSNDSSIYKEPKPDKIEGFCNYVLAANDKMFFMNKGNSDNSQLKKAGCLKNNFIIDSIEPTAPSTDWSEYWNNYVDDLFPWGGYSTEIPQKITDLKQKMLTETSPFVNRLVTGSDVTSGGVAVEHQSLNVFSKLESSLNGLVSASSNPYIIEPLDGNLNNPAYLFNAGGYEDKYFLVVNTDATLDLILDSTIFNGIIFTTGKVILKDGAKVNGAIVAAGKGYDADIGVKGSAAETVDNTLMVRAPRIKRDGSNEDNLKNGDYAAVYCADGNVAISFPDPDPEIGRSMLLDKFLYQDIDHPIDLYNIF